MSSEQIKPGYKRTEVGVIPEDWGVAVLGDVCDVRDGTHESPRFLTQGVPFVTSKNIINGCLDLDNVSYISKTDAIEFDKRSKVEINDILMSMIGTIGSSVHVNFTPNFCIKNVALIKPKKIDPYFLAQLINSSFFQKSLHENLDGGIQKFIALGTLRQIAAPLPTPSEQRDIAAVLLDLDSLLAQIDQLIAKKRDLKQAAMQQLLTGQTRLPGFSGKWEVKLLPEVCHFRSGKAHEQFISDAGTYICVNSKFISTNGEVQKYSTVNLCDARRDDILMVMSDLPNGRALAKAYLVEKNNLYAINQRICALTSYGDYPKYLFYALNRNPYFLKFDDGVNQTHLLNNVFRNCPILLPPTLDEQRAIATFLTDIDSELAALEERKEKTSALKQSMMQELLTGMNRLS